MKNKLVSESLEDFIGAERLDEGIFASNVDDFKKGWLMAANAYAAKPESAKQVVNWAKKIKELGTSKDSEVKKALGDESYKKFELLVNAIKRLTPTMGSIGSAGSAVKANVGKDDNERAATVANAIGDTAANVLALKSALDAKK
jgi:hypothetical protein